VQINLGKQIFSAGQAYVALSRVKSLEGLFITEFDPESIRAHNDVKRFYNNLVSRARGSDVDNNNKEVTSSPGFIQSIDLTVSPLQLIQTQVPEQEPVQTSTGFGQASSLAFVQTPTVDQPSSTLGFRQKSPSTAASSSPTKILGVCNGLRKQLIYFRKA
jgi:hypothetical protein